MTPPVHPILLRLVASRYRQWAGAQIRDVLTPQRMPLWILLGVWLAQALYCLWLRDPMDAVECRRWILMLFSGYFVWYLVAAATVTRNPFGWTDAECCCLLTAPLKRQDLVFYYLATRIPGALGKGLLLCCVFLHELHSPVAALIAATLAMLSLDAIRATLDCIKVGLTDVGKLRFQTVVYSAAACALALAIVRCVGQAGAPPTMMTLGLADSGLTALVGALREMNESTFAGLMLNWPWQPFAATIAAPAAFGTSNCLLACSTTCVLCVYALLLADKWCDERDVWAEYFPPVKRVRSAGLLRFGTGRLGPAGELAKLQWIRLAHCWPRVATSLAITGVVACLPLLRKTDAASDLYVFGKVGLWLIVLTLILLPAVLRFDFRSKNHLASVHALPISSKEAVWGELLVPLVVSFVFQAIVLLAAMFTLSIEFQYVIAGAMCFIPFNAMVFAAENYVCILLPNVNYERDFVITTVFSFTAKCLLLLFGAILCLSTVVVSRAIAVHLGVAPFPVVFTVAFGTLSLVAQIATRRLVDAFAGLELS